MAYSNWPPPGYGGPYQPPPGQQPYNQQPYNSPPYNQPLYRPYGPPPSHQYRPPTPPVANRPPGGKADQAYLWALFQQVDRDRSGAIDAVELQEALSNGTGTPFNPETVRLMIAMLDKKNTGSITFGEFGALWKYIDDWQTTFHRFDKDKSGGIDCDELKQCLSAFGYRLSDRFYQMSLTRFDRTKKGQIHFDDFVQLCVQLQTLTAAFREKDAGRKGKIIVNYEDFLLMVFQAQL